MAIGAVQVNISLVVYDQTYQEAKWMTTAQRTGIAAPVNGMMVYDTTVGAIYGYESGAWVNI